MSSGKLFWPFVALTFISFGHSAPDFDTKKLTVIWPRGTLLNDPQHQITRHLKDYSAYSKVISPLLPPCTEGFSTERSLIIKEYGLPNSFTLKKISRDSEDADDVMSPASPAEAFTRQGKWSALYGKTQTPPPSPSLLSSSLLSGVQDIVACFFSKNN